ncbi:MAG TPA: FAD-binding oxidoreductase [Chloroflexi bacterium]|nr:FAD-binding oxidoreductase [Chloroflexota bacterium]
MLPKSSDIVIIGGGVMGASAAYHLAKRGAQVTLLEKAPSFGEASTGKCAGGIRHQFSTEVNIRLSIESFKMMARFPDELGQELGLNQIGYLFLLEKEESLTQFKKNVALQNSLEIESLVLTPAQLAARLPYLNLEGVIGGAFCSADGLADPHSMVQGYIKGAKRLGASLFTDAPVTDIEVVGEKIKAVVTPQGKINTDTVVVAAGAWSGQIGEMLGVDIPVAPVRRQIAVTRPLPEFKSLDWTFILFFDQSLYFHPEGEGLLTGMSNPDEAVSFNEDVDPDWTLKHIEQAIYRFPLLEKAQLLTEWAGLYEVTPDHQAILGRLPGVENAVCIAGFSGHGFMHGPICGLLMAEELLDGKAHTVNIDDLRYERFEKEGVDVAEFNVV